MSISRPVRAPLRFVRTVLGVGLACGAGITCGGDGAGPTTTVGINSSARSVGFSVAPGGSVAPKSVTVTPTTGQLTGLKAQITYVAPTGPAWLDASFATTTATVDAPGVLTLQVTKSDLSPGTYTASVTVSADNAANAPKIQVSFIVEAASALVLTTQPSTTGTSGAPFAEAPVVGLQTASGAPVAQAGVVISVSLEGDGTLAGPASATTDAQGLATFDGLSITGLAGDRTLLFTSPGLNEVRSNPVTITSGTAALLVASSVTTQFAEAGTPVNEPPVALVTDAAGNPIAGVVVTFAVTGGGIISPTTPVTTTDAGLATLNSWQLGPIAGANTVTATAAGLAGSPLQFSATGTNGGVVPGPISQSKSSVTASPATFAAGSSGTTITVTARDDGNNLIGGATVSLSSSGTNFAFGSTSLTTGTNGITLGKATTTYTSTKAEGKAITAQVTAGGVTVTPAPASVTVTAGAPSGATSSVTATSPPPGLANSSTVTVTVKDANGNPVGGRAVTLAFVSGSGGTITQPSSTTNPTTGVTQGSISSSTGGTYQVSATVSGAPSTVISQMPSITFLLSFAADIEPIFTVGHPNADPTGAATTSACSSCHLPYVTNGSVPDLSFAHITDVHDAGNVVVIGNPDASLLIKALEHDGSLLSSELMPATNQRLSPALIQLIRQWIAQDPTTLRP